MKKSAKKKDPEFILPDDCIGKKSIKISRYNSHFKPRSLTRLYDWIDRVIQSEGFFTGEIRIVLCDDLYLLEVNKKHLNHDFFTDVITFNYCNNKIISGDILISTDRIAENAEKFRTNLQDEFARVMIHGVLHLCGYNDKTASEVKKMRRKENDCLEALKIS